MWGSGVTAVLLTMEFLEVAMNTVNKAAMSKGMSQFVLVVYSNILGVLLLLSSSFIFYRMERLDLRSKSSQAKFVGTMVLIAGGLVVTLYKGLPIAGSPTSTDKLQNLLLLLGPSNWAIGGFFLAAHSFVLALIFVVQTWIIRDYPSEILITLISSSFVTILSAIVSLIVEVDLNAWRIRPNIELAATGFSAVFAVSLRSIVHTWACHKKGPVYTSMFKPIGMVLAVFIGVSFLGDTLYLGSVMGAVIIALGFYAVVWGKSQEARTVEDEEKRCFESSSPRVPLLQNICTNL